MYTFEDKGGRSITLRPEGTSSASRSYIENGLFNTPQPSKLFYNITCYRYEKNQAGRYREFHQFGAEVIGSKNPSVDAELMSLPMLLYKRLGLTNLKLNINSIGCPKCRKEYNEKLRDFLRPKYDELCDTCKSRFEKNPLRILDCKSKVCKELSKGAPMLLDCICDECREHFDAVKSALENMGIEYFIDPYIVRGLDYYTKTVFEIIADNKNSNSTICGGGRYDGLVEQLGHTPTPASGFALGIERLILTMEEQGIKFPDADVPDIFIGSMGDKASTFVQGLAFKLRENGVKCEIDHLSRSVKAQMKFANKIGAKNAVIVGENEMNENRAHIKNMADGTQTECSLDAQSIKNALGI